MKNLLGCLGLLGLAVLGLLITSLLIGTTDEQDQQREFLVVVSQGDLAAVRERLHPELNRELDPEVLGALVTTTQEMLGEFREFPPAGLETDIRQDADGLTITSQGKAQFEKGETTVQIVLRDGMVVVFNIGNADFFLRAGQSPELLELLERYGLQFVERCFRDELADAYQQLTEQLREQVERREFDRIVREAVEKLTQPKAIRPLPEATEVSRQGTIVMSYELEYDDGNRPVVVRFGFDGLKASIVAFRLDEDESEP